MRNENDSYYTEEENRREIPTREIPMDREDRGNTRRDKVPVREVRLEKNDDDDYGQSSSVRNTELVIVTYLIGALFLLLIGYLVYFTVIRRDEITSNVYNTRSDVDSERILRGSILTEDGEELAYTSLDYSGNEVRVYPYYSMFAHVIGYATNGRGGLEASANSQLLSSHSSMFEQLENVKNKEKMPGDSIVVTLSTKMQQAAWNALGSYKGAIVVMEPDSGKILAMVSKPDFDPNVIGENWESLVNDPDSSALLNRASQGLYPPGSIFKILTTLAYIRQNPGGLSSFSYNCSGTLQGNDILLTCYNSTAHGQETLKSAFANSCNTAFAQIGLSLDKKRFRSLAETFFFNKDLPVSWPHGQSVFRLDAKTSDDDVMTTAIGQGETLVTPLHMAMITSAVANGGIMMKPYLISSVVSSDGKKVSQTKPEICKEVMSLEESAILVDCMKETVLSGTGNALAWNSYSVAGKTGSAEYESGGSMGTHSWFVGFSNVDDPDIVVAIIAEDGGTGSSTAVPMAQQIFDAYYYG